MIDLDDLESRACSGTLPAGEVAALVESIGRLIDPDDEWRVVWIVGVAAQHQPESNLQAVYLPWMEGYLRRRDDPWLVRTALTVLLNRWNLAGDRLGDYLDEVIALIGGIRWDIPEDVRFSDDAQIVATSQAGIYLAAHVALDLLDALIRVFDNVSHEDGTRHFALEAIGLAMGLPWQSLLSWKLGTQPDFEELARVEWLVEARKRLMREQAAR